MTLDETEVTGTTVKTKEEDDSKGNAITATKKATRVPTVGRRKKMPTNGRHSKKK